MKMILMSAFHRHVSIMPRVAMFLAVIPVSAHQDTLESCAIRTLIIALNSHVITGGLARME